ncbi:cytochrome c556 [Rhodobacter aestuarii]|uniref:Cytochrome c556 n=1 Tax=Rhodobacter aestuarii TaxID=453582 RepID=A0A1N7QHT3_9RHOB|nr:cytochrome c [Rhodobacter aestuarii]PTV93312.1 cytochrome c556 [Rhodobacter aestuarii]SIT22432.1 Cytochrome c556 [Rhodobacter aestuarii]
MKTVIFALIALGVATMAFAHGGVKNPAVLARMENMKAISDQMKGLAAMAKEERPFDAAQIVRSLEQISADAARIPALFQAPETDPKSEALPAIWQEFDRFENLSADLSVAVTEVGAPENLTDLRSAVQQIGVTCKACHDPFRD